MYPRTPYQQFAGPYGYPAQAYGYQYAPPPNWQVMAQRFGQRPMVAGGEFDVIAGGDVDLIAGAEMIGADDPDAAALLAGLDAGLIGAEEIGLDASEIGAEEIESGARAPRGGLMLARNRPLLFAGQMMRAARAAKAAQQQPVIVDKPYTKTRKLPLGVDSGADILAGSAQVLTVIPNGPFKPKFLLIPDDIAADFVITALQFGRVNGLAGANEVPASTYQESGDGRLNEFDVPAVSPGIPIQVGVRNVSGANRRFRARFQGVILES